MEENSLILSVQSETNSSDTDITRAEMKWNDEAENFLKQISLECQGKSTQQYSFYRKNKILHLVVTVPSVMIPIITSTLESTVLLDFPYVATYLILLGGLLSGINSIFNFNTRFFNNSMFEDKYLDLKSQIDLELVKDKKVRQPTDVFLQKITDNYNRINESAPKQ
tara:strand:+ start:399 stop:896 length:498 start_codon:yes stop_codon:yes gene_type:complete